MKACQETWKFSLTLKENQQKRADGEIPETVLSNRTSVMMKMFHFCTVRYGSHQSCVPVEHLNVASMTEKLNFTFYFTLINLNIHTWQAVTVLDSTALEGAPGCRCEFAVNHQRWQLRIKSWMQSQREQVHAGVSRHLCTCLTAFRASAGLLLLFCFPESHLSLSCGQLQFRTTQGILGNWGQ